MARQRTRSERLSWGVLVFLGGCSNSAMEATGGPEEQAWMSDDAAEASSAGGAADSATTSGQPGLDGTTGPSTGENGGAANTGFTGGPPFTGQTVDAGDVMADAAPVDAGSQDAGAGLYRPCASDAGSCKILPLGDSITFGLGVTGGGGYRVELFRKALADGKSITFVGSEVNGPREIDGVPFPGAHEGHSGWTIDQVAGLVPTPALAEGPEIILLMAGTNDVSWANPTGAPERLDALLGKLVAAAPDALVVVAQLTPLGRGNEAVAQFNTALPSIVEARANLGEHILMVDMFSGFDTDMLADGVHPDAAGYAHMAGIWYAAISSALP